MKNKILKILLVGVMVLSLTACGNSQATTSESKEADTTNAEVSVEEENQIETEEISKTEESDEIVTIRLGDQTVWGSILWQYADEIGILDSAFEGYNVEISISDFENGPAENESFAGDQLDFAYMGNVPAVSGASNGYGTKLVGAISYSTDLSKLVVPIDSDIQSVEELKGQQVGTVIGGGLHYTLAVYLENAGLSLDDVEVINTGSETVTAIRGGEVAAGTVTPTQAEILVSEGSGKVIASSVPGVGSNNFIVASETFLVNYPEYAEILLQVAEDTLVYEDEHQEEYFAFYESLTGVDSSALAATWDITDHHVRTITGEIYNSDKSFIQWMIDADLIPETNLDDVIDNSYADAIGLTGIE